MPTSPLSLSAGRRPGRFAHAAGLARLIVCVAGLLSACYSPDIKSGALRCADDQARSCPDGFYCDGTGGHCWKKSDTPVGGGGGLGGGGGRGGAGGASGCTDRVRPSCAGTPLMSGDLCDPFCQSGPCSCGQKCSFSSTNQSTNFTACVPNAGTKKEGELCNADLDDCAPGLLCQREACAAGVARCYRFCRANTDCAPVACVLSLSTSTGTSPSFRLCDNPEADCNPVKQTGCPTGLACLAKSSNSFFCACPSATPKAEGAPCNLVSECAPGFLCQALNGPPTCQRLCRDANDCPRADGGAPRTCSATLGASALGFCSE